MAFEYPYAKDADPARLTHEIETSEITVALSHVNTGEGTVSVYFKAQLSADEQAVLDTLVAAHVAEPLEAPAEPVSVALSQHRTDQGVPYLHATPRPMGYTSYFSCAGDGPEGVGTGERLLFNMMASDTAKSVDVTFSEQVFLKSGLALPEDAPFGATMDIAVVHPVYGHLQYFCKQAPVAGSHPADFGTADSARIPQGLIIRVTVHNARGIDGEDAPRAFKLAGRMELYRPKLPFDI